MKSIYKRIYIKEFCSTLLFIQKHYNDVIMNAMGSQFTCPTIVYSTVYSDADQRKHQSSASLAFVRGIHRWPVNSSYKGPVMFPFHDVISSANIFSFVFQKIPYQWFHKFSWSENIIERSLREHFEIRWRLKHNIKYRCCVRKGNLISLPHNACACWH